jgi:hypothetical protein
MSSSHWMHGFGGEPKETAAKLKALNFDTVVAGGDDVIRAVADEGMSSWLYDTAFRLGAFDDDDHKAWDINGKPCVWYGSGCPTDPDIRAANLETFANMAKTAGISGVLLGGCHWASPADGLDTFLTCFNPKTEKRAKELGYDFDRIRRDVKALHDVLYAIRDNPPTNRGLGWISQPIGIAEWLAHHPGITAWMSLRRVTSTEYSRDISRILKGAGLEMGVYIFTPSFAPLVGQSYVDLSEFVDVFAPMLYRNYPVDPGSACINWELTKIPRDMGIEGTDREKDVMTAVLAIAGLSGIVSDRKIADINNAVPPAVVGHETRMARELIGEKSKLIPIIHMNDPVMEETADLVKGNGADGVSFFRFMDGWENLVKPTITA